MTEHSYFWNVISANKPTKVELPAGEELYEINLNTREIKGPPVLGVKEDHESQIIYFTVDRYYEIFDLKDTNCIVQFETLTRENNVYKGIYCIPFYDLETLADEEKMILPWVIRNSITQSASEIKYSFRFYSVATREDETNIIDFNLNTIPTTGKILDTITNSTIDFEKDETVSTQLEEIWNAIGASLKWSQTNWEIFEEE